MQNKITEGSIWKQLLLFFFPILIGSFFQQLYNTVDAIVVGKFLGSHALAAVGGSSAMIISMLVGFFVGISSGAGIVIGHHYGAKHIDKTHHAVQLAFLIALVFGVILLFIGFFFSKDLLMIMQEPQEILPLSLRYIKVYFLGSIFSLTYNIGASILTAIGDSKKPLYILISAMLINLTLDVAFVKYLNMGVEGVALATIIAQAVSMIIVIYILTNTKDSYHLDLKNFKYDPELLKKIVIVGIPTGIQSLMYSISNMAIQTSINSFGTDTIAAYTVYGKIDGVFWMIMTAFGISAMTFVAQNYGAKKYERVKKSVNASLVLAFSVTFILSAILFFGSEWLFYIFTDNHNVMKIGNEMMKFLVPLYFTWVCIEIYSNVIRAMGDSLGPLIISLVLICLLRVAWVYLVMPIKHDYILLLACYPISWILGSLAFKIYYHYKVKQIF